MITGFRLTDRDYRGRGCRHAPEKEKDSSENCLSDLFYDLLFTADFGFLAGLAVRDVLDAAVFDAAAFGAALAAGFFLTGRLTISIVQF